MKSDAKLTLSLLQQVSDHLSRHIECRGSEYRLTITPNSIELYPNIEMYNSRGKRYKIRVLDHILLDHFYTSLYDKLSDAGEIEVNTSSLVIGTYVYQLSVSRKARRWTKIPID